LAERSALVVAWGNRHEGALSPVHARRGDGVVPLCPGDHIPVRV